MAGVRCASALHEADARVFSRPHQRGYRAAGAEFLVLLDRMAGACPALARLLLLARSERHVCLLETRAAGLDLPARAQSLGAEVPSTHGATARPQEDLPGCHVRDHAPRPRGVD